MQYYSSQGDTTHKGLYPGKIPFGCVMQYAECLASVLGMSLCLCKGGPPAANHIPDPSLLPLGLLPFLLILSKSS